VAALRAARNHRDPTARRNIPTPARIGFLPGLSTFSDIFCLSTEYHGVHEIRHETPTQDEVERSRGMVPGFV
jgi:hypothetical protein